MVFYTGRHGSIMSFDLEEEIFLQTLMLPVPVQTMDGTPTVAAGVVGNCLSIYAWHQAGDRNEYKYEFWRMESGVRSSWIILFRIEGLTMPLLSFAATKDGKIILDQEKFYFRVYDPSKRRSSSEKLSDCRPWMYEQTLVSPHT